jgi:hypothetical protein
MLKIGTNYALYFQEVIKMDQDDLDTISEIAAKYGFSEWALIGFTTAKEYHIFSYFNDLSVMPAFRIILISILKTVDDYMRNNMVVPTETVHAVGTC